MRKAGAHIISFLLLRHSILVQRNILEPIRSPFLPSDGDLSKNVGIISSDESIRKALQRIEDILSNHFPGLISSLLQPILLNLFYLTAYTQNTVHQQIKAQVTRILTAYLSASSCPGADVLRLVENISHTPSAYGWTYTPGDQGGIAIRRTTADDSHDTDFDTISSRVLIIVETLRDTSDMVKSEVFVGVIRYWLSPRQDDPIRYHRVKYCSNSGGLRTLSYCKNYCQIINKTCSSHRLMGFKFAEKYY